MNIMKLLLKCLFVTGTCVLLTLVGCTSNKPFKDPSLNVTPNWSKYQDTRKGTENYIWRTLGLDNEHLSKPFTFLPGIAESISQMPGIQSAYVLSTEENCYVAVVPNGHNPNSNASQEILNHSIDKIDGGGFFDEPDTINRVDWISQSSNLPTRTLNVIGRDAAKYMPDNIKRIYVSANPNFINCLRFYAKEEQVLGDLSMYMNEINMIVEMVFPT